MQFGFSSYSFFQHMRTDRMTLLDVIDWIADSDATHMEIATVSLCKELGKDTSTLDEDPKFVKEIGARAADKGITLSNFVVPADLLGDEADQQMARLKRHIDVAVVELDPQRACRMGGIARHVAGALAVADNPENFRPARRHSGTLRRAGVRAYDG